MDLPSVFLYANTFRWFQNYQAVNISRVSRPIKRGKYYNNVKPKKQALGRQYKYVIKQPLRFVQTISFQTVLNP